MQTKVAVALSFTLPSMVWANSASYNGAAGALMPVAERRVTMLSEDIRFHQGTDLNGAWVASVEGSRDDALAVLPEAVFDIAVMALAHKPRTQRETTRALKSLQTKRATKNQAERKALGKARRTATTRAEAEAKAAGVELPNISKGSRVKIIGDVQSTRGCKGKGVYGTVFWCGYGKRGTQKRVGLKSNSGDKYWADLTDVELVTRRKKKSAKS